MAVRKQEDPEAGPGLARRPDVEQTPSRKAVVGLLAVIVVILIAWALRGSAVVTMPLAFAFFVAILVHPIERTLAAHLPDQLEWLGVLCAMLAVVGVLALAVALLSFTLAPVLERAPQ